MELTFTFVLVVWWIGAALLFWFSLGGYGLLDLAGVPVKLVWVGSAWLTLLCRFWLNVVILIVYVGVLVCFDVLYLVA